MPSYTPWLLLVVASVALVSCRSAPPPAATAAVKPVLNGDRLGRDFLAAARADQLSYCVRSVKAYKTSAVSSFSVSPSIGNITPETLCGQLAEYFNDEPVRQDERLSQASATAMLLYSKPSTRRQKDAELEQMERRDNSGR